MGISHGDLERLYRYHPHHETNSSQATAMHLLCQITNRSGYVGIYFNAILSG